MPEDQKNLTSAEFLEDLASRLFTEIPRMDYNIPHGHSISQHDVERLSAIAAQLDVMEGLVTTDPPPADTKTVDPSDPYMSNEEAEKWLDLWMARKNRDLVAELRQLIRNPLGDGINMFDEILDDHDLARDIHDKTAEYDELDLPFMEIALRKLRAEFAAS